MLRTNVVCKSCQGSKFALAVFACVLKYSGIVNAFDVTPKMTLSMPAFATDSATVPIRIGCFQLNEFVELVFSRYHIITSLRLFLIFCLLFREVGISIFFV